MALTNQAKNSSTPTNQEFSSSGLIWNDADFTWDEAAGTWNNPYNFANQAKNSGIITNQAITP